MVYHAKKPVLHPPFRPRYFIFHFLVFIFLVLWLGMLYGLVFGVGLGLSSYMIFLILMASLIGSNINIPLFYVRSWKPIIKAEVVKVFLWDFIVPTVDWEEAKTLISVNVGGCIIPVALSLYLIYKMILATGIHILIPLIIAIAINSILINSVSRPVEGLGIVTPALLPPLFTVIVSELVFIFTPPVNVFAFIYTVGTLGSLIGADLLNLDIIPRLGAPVASIGGAGIFDGIFLNGIFAVVLAMM